MKTTNETNKAFIRGNIVMNDSKNAKMISKRKGEQLKEFVAGPILIALVIVFIYVVIFTDMDIYRKILGIVVIFGIIASMFLQMPFTIRFLRVYEKGISLPGRVELWRTVTGKTEDYIPFTDIAMAYPNVGCPIWTLPNAHFILVMKDGEMIYAQKHYISDSVELAKAISKYGNIPLITDKLYVYRVGEVLPMPLEVKMTHQHLNLIFKDGPMIFNWNDIKEISGTKRHTGVAIECKDGRIVRIVALHKEYKRHLNMIQTITDTLKKYKISNSYRG